ncbi:hypothetical protein HPB51_025263 [Rhipicephalus microplus]|uniref:NOL9 C-terminal domain-containing protein n=1 Tax=Rhipicephalus microplus TaxID=6941 RepID=A0A9J6DKA3_RHIMP|nr:hypothetical protein HPB51_025263 [Rhipicephalus microplus]
MPPICIDCSGVEAIIRSLRLSSIPGCDQIDPKFLKSTCASSSVILTMIFQQSLDQGCLPTEWKIGKVTPFHKADLPSTLAVWPTLYRLCANVALRIKRFPTAALLKQLPHLMEDTFSAVHHHYGYLCEDKHMLGSMLETENPSYPKFINSCGPYECLGYGLVRAIDPSEKLFYITTPEPSDRLSQVNALVRGDIHLPESLLTAQAQLLQCAWAPYLAKASSEPDPCSDGEEQNDDFRS